MSVTTEKQQKISPMMAQWQACKEVASDAVLFFQMGDFYEAFYDDATLLAKELDLTLTKRQEIPMSGVPLHTCEAYIDKLISKGYRVAVAEQTEDPKKTKGLVKREVVRIITPGAVVNSSLVRDAANNFCASVAQVGSCYGLASLDLTTGEFQVIELENTIDLFNEIYRLKPSEIVISQKFQRNHAQLLEELSTCMPFLTTPQEDWQFEHQLSYETLVMHFNVQNLDGFGLKGKVTSINAAGVLLLYVRDILMHSLDHVASIHFYSISEYLSLDYMSERNLEILEPLRKENLKNTLLSVLDQTDTPMGGRLMRRWMIQPLLNLEEIQRRQDAVSELQLNEVALDGIKDLERLMMKITSSYATPRDLIALKLSLEPLAAVKDSLNQSHSLLLQQIQNAISPLPELQKLIADAIVDEPPLRISEGDLIREGFHKELDGLRALRNDSKAWISCYQSHLREKYSIKSLKVGYNRMFGYYIEVSKGQTGKMPPSFHRRQTLANAERYISPELKNYESKVLNAEDKILRIESELFNQLRQQIAAYAGPVNTTTKAIAKLDCLKSFAQVAKENHYCRPNLNLGNAMNILGGRHPVIEKRNTQETFIANDTHMDQNERLALITGPNMAGKSTYIRQVALIVLMAQMGSFVPAKEANLGLVDQIFTRIGASDDLARGQSTFMVEMTETANILNHATERSLIILDEIGRGTSTYDGISIAWAVVEYLLTAHSLPPLTLFATHYWELTKLQEKIAGAVNYHVAVQEVEDHIIFLRKIVKGGTDKSYGIHVARLAGMPPWVIMRAQEILLHLEENGNRKNAFEPKKTVKKPTAHRQRQDCVHQLQLFS